MSSASAAPHRDEHLARRILIVGGHGKVALLTCPLLASEGHRVTALIRAASQEDEVAATGAEPVVADVEQLSTEELTQMLRGHDVVIWSAGAGGGDPARTRAVDRDAAIRTIDAAVAASIPQFVMVSYFGAGKDHGVPAGHPFHAYAEAKAAADSHLQRSGLQWTILRPSRLTFDPPTGAIDTGATHGSHVSRGNVARVIQSVVDADPATVARTVIALNDGPTPVDQAISAASSRADTPD